MPNTQVTLISLYGKKKPEFEILIARCQRTVADTVGDAFEPYQPDQIHATIVGLERRLGSTLDNENFAKFRNRNVAMVLDDFLAYLRGCGHLPMEVQIGGFQARDYPFTSRKLRPFERTFSIQGDKVVIMGWPVRGEPLSTAPATPEAFSQESRIYPPTLDQLRHAAQRFGVLHGYHRTATDVDNDMFFRIGLIDPKSVALGSVRPLEQRLRQHLAEERPLILEVTLQDVFVAAYVDNTLPPSTTKTSPVTDPSVNGQSISSLYT